MKHFLSLADIPSLPKFLEEAKYVKQNPNNWRMLGANKSMCLIFFNPSLRTRLSAQKAAFNLGLNAAVLDVNEDSWKLEFADGVVMDGDKAEHIKEAAAVIGEYFDVVGIRAFASLKNKENDYNERVLSAFKAYCPASIINMESATGHPLQAFADLITIEEHKTVKKPKVVLTWAPHPRALPQAVANSFAEWSQAAGYDVVITHPEGYELDEKFTGSAKIEYNQNKAFEDADFIYAKNWSSFTNYGNILSKDRNWMVTEEKMSLTSNGKFLHCLPVRRNMIVEDAVLDGARNLAINEAANRVVSMQTVLKLILEEMDL